MTDYGIFKVYPPDSRYEVSDQGWIKNVRTGRITKGHKNKFKGYLYFQVGGKDGIHVQVGRMVLETFVGPMEGYVCDHINRIRDDNRLENLRWVDVTTNNNNRTVTNGREVYLYKKGKLVKKFDMVKDAAEFLGVSHQAVSSALTRPGGKTNCKGYYLSPQCITFPHAWRVESITDSNHTLLVHSSEGFSVYGPQIKYTIDFPPSS